jgi:DNA modification methylase
MWTGITRQNIEWNVFQGDSRIVLQQLPSNYFNCVITSPPYFWLRDYGTIQQIGLEETVDDYVNSIATVMDEVYRVLKPDGLLFLNLGDTYYSGKGKPHGKDRKNSKRRIGLRAVDKSGGMGIGLVQKSIIGTPWRVATEMMCRNWILRSPIIWHRSKVLPEGNVKDRPRRSYEYVFMFAKSRKYYFDHLKLEGYGEQDIWTIDARPQSTNGIRTAPFPDELVQRCLDIGCLPNGRVLDPFAGSGTTLRVATKSGHTATGIELNTEFCHFIVKQLEGL